LSKIAVIDVPADSGGALTILNEYYRQANADKNHEWLFILSTPKLKATKNIEVLNYPWIKKSWLHRLYFDIFIAHKVINRYGADTILSLQNTRVSFAKQPTEIYLHQTLPFAKKRYSLIENPKFWVYQNIISKVIFRSLKHASKITVQTKWVAEALVATVGIPKNKITITQPKLSENFSAKYQPPTKGSVRRFIYPAAPYDYKNHQIIIEALKIMRRNGISDCVVEFTFTKDQNPLAANLYAQARRYHLPVEFIGSVEYSKLCDRYSHAILLFPSKLESFGMPLLEARTSQTPIIAADEVYSREVLEDYNNAQFFAADNKLKLAELMTSTIDQGGQRAKDEAARPVDLLFIGGMYSPAKYKDYLRDSPRGLQGAVDIHQWNLINGFKKIKNTTVHQLSAPYLAAYPSFKKLFVNAVSNDLFHSIGYVNLPILKDFMRSALLKRRVATWANDKTEDDKVVMCYYVSIPQMQAALSAGPGIHKTLVIADVPGYLNLSQSQSIFTNLVSRLKNYRIRKLVKRFDSYVVVTKYIADLLNLPHGSWIVSEGMVGEDRVANLNAIKKRKFPNNDVIYAGGLHEKYGVKELLNTAISLTDENIDFYFYGSGEMAEEINNASKKYRNIHAMGYTSHEIIIEHQRRAKILINPRRNEHDYVRYSFPSKNIEYLMSGTPVLCYKIDSIPNDYDDVFIYIDNERTDALKEAILKTVSLSTDSLRQIGTRASKFVSEHKTNTIQALMIMKFINERRRENSDGIATSSTVRRGILSIIRNNILISLFTAYLFLSYVLYLIGPLDYNTKHLFIVSLIVIINVMMVPLGYAVASRLFTKKRALLDLKSNSESKTKFPLNALIGIMCILGAANAALQLAALIGANNGVELARQVVTSIQNPGGAYELFVANRRGFSSEVMAASRIASALAPLTYFALVVGLFRFKLLGWWARGAVAIYTATLLASTFATGQNIGIFNVLVIFISIIILKISTIKRARRKQVLHIFSIVAALTVVMLSYFATNTLDRLNTRKTMQSFSGANVNRDSIPLRLTPQPLENSVIMGSFYLASGYKAIDYALDYSFTTTYGFGSGYFPLNVYRAATGTDIFERSYVSKISPRWHPTINWHTAYLWFANDVSFIGLPIVTFIIGFLFFVIYRLAKRGNLFAIAVFPLYISLLLFLPCNNLVLGNPSSAVAFIVLTALTIISTIFNDRLSIFWIKKAPSNASQYSQ